MHFVCNVLCAAYPSVVPQSRKMEFRSKGWGIVGYLKEVGLFTIVYVKFMIRLIALIRGLLAD